MVSATPGQSRAGQTPQRSLEEIAKELENPMSTTWSLVFQDNLNLLQGDAVEGTQVGDTFLFQPALPIPMGRRAVLIARPVFPIVSLPELDAASPGGVKGRQTGFGDMQVLALLGTTTPKGLVYAAGVTSIFPTASNENLGGGKYQAGPSVALAKVGAKLVYGISAQHWWSFAGDDARRDVSQTNIGYFLSKTLPKAWSVGTSPTISINWNGADRNRLTFPVGLGPSKMVRIGSTPVRLRFEVQYSVVRPESYGTRWNFRFQAVPVIKSPFAR